ncbi:beta-N-acetylhexosaminidase [Variovorax ginsengisoli]|uniref:Beta-hexosaminidase n=1 Tax=Variovorax ginsengisoli TaxID=363844 RepID=A0ABT9S0D6_9BURK|nr:beta-N-acetylhexosaminidase [Variovorax ginsengisoli]MDP9897816.1 beta-N-acetylhexosaminidase [Variovorax ginsengisoli]
MTFSPPSPDGLHAPLIIDVAGTELTADDRRRIADPRVGGVIHFARNWQDRAQMQALNAELKALRPDLLISVDQEGGRVQRFRTDGFTRLPSMRLLGEHWMRSPMQATRAATAVGFVLASELRACGVDFSFTPVLDLDHGESSVIGDRSFHRDPRVVSLLAKSLSHGLLRAGMANCGKHFPGHGFVKADSHVAVPVDRRGLKAILADDAQPYDWLGGALAAVMPAHVIYSKVDALPAGFSAKWLGGILRTRLGFEGAVFSDDLSMEAARRIDHVLLSYTDAALAALQAGCDLALLCNQSIGTGAPLDELLAGFDAAQRDGRWQPRAVSEARRRALLPRGEALSWDALQDSPDYRQAQRLVTDIAGG